MNVTCRVQTVSPQLYHFSPHKRPRIVAITVDASAGFGGASWREEERNGRKGRQERGRKGKGRRKEERAEQEKRRKYSIWKLKGASPCLAFPLKILDFSFTEASNVEVEDTAGMSKHRLKRHIMPTISNNTQLT